MKINFTYTDELYHYGVKGMKWGVRRGRMSSDRIRGKRRRMSPEQRAKLKRAALIGAGALATAGIAYGTHKYMKGKRIKPLKLGKRRYNRNLIYDKLYNVSELPGVYDYENYRGVIRRPGWNYMLERKPFKYGRKRIKKYSHT